MYSDIQMCNLLNQATCGWANPLYSPMYLNQVKQWSLRSIKTQMNCSPAPTPPQKSLERVACCHRCQVESILSWKPTGQDGQTTSATGSGSVFWKATVLSRWICRLWRAIFWPQCYSPLAAQENTYKMRLSMENLPPNGGSAAPTKSAMAQELGSPEAAFIRVVRLVHIFRDPDPCL